MARAPAGAMASTVGMSTTFTGYATMTGGGNMWGYRSTDLVATVCGSSYFTNGMQLGMRLGDLVYIIDTGQSTMQISFAPVNVVTTGTTGPGGVTLTTGNLGSTI